MATNRDQIGSLFHSLALAVEPDGAEWLWQYEPRHLLKRSVPDLFEGLSAHARFRAPLRDLAFAFVARKQLNVAASVLRHHFFAYGVYKWEKRSQYEDQTFLSEKEVQNLSESVSRCIVEWVNDDISQLKRVISSQVIFIAQDLGEWGERERANISTLFDEPDSLLAMMLLFYDGQGMTETATMEKLADREVFVKRLLELREGSRFAALNENTKAGLQSATSDDPYR